MPSAPQYPARLALIAALADNDVIGRDNCLPWHLPADLAHFRRLTLDKPIIMGRRTWESLPGLLPRRRHIVLTRDPDYRAEGCTLARSLDEALEAAGAVEEAMIVGGAMLYAEALGRADRLYLTRVHVEPEGDRRFPRWEPSEWREVAREERPGDADNPLAMTFIELHRRRAAA
ncbi:MAG: dihydrofolate reductase [Chromatiaceae bacterium]|nr:dihydrofolate reductase [Chromatiaceae bacterium]